MRVVDWSPAELRARLGEAMALYAEAMGYPPEAGQHRAGFAVAHTRRPGFRAVAAVTGPEPGELAGYATAAGQWWHDQVRAALPPGVARSGWPAASSSPNCTCGRRTRATGSAGRC